MSILSRLLPRAGRLTIKEASSAERTDVDAYWSRHTVNSTPFESAQQSADYLKWRNEQYPLFPEFMEMWGRHDGETVLDYGCGPGNDVVGFLLYGGASRVVGIDVSPKALDLARHRLALHGFAPSRVELIHTGDSELHIPLGDNSIDYINCGGVLHHTSHPEAILDEFRRVLKVGGRGRIMVYNRQSLWFHLYVAYIRTIVDGAFEGLSIEQAFGRSTDGEDCPISIPYRPDEFVRLLEESGLDARFVGGYLSVFEIKCWRDAGEQAIADQRLGQEHRRFLSELTWDSNGLPLWNGKHAGIGGVYEFAKT